MTEKTPEGFHELLVRLAREEGFALAGGVDIDQATGFPAHVARYDEWLASGLHGAMSYLERGRDRRSDPRAVFPEARSVFCAAIPYRRQPSGRHDAAEGGRYARYIDGPDYHDWIAERLETAMLRAREESGDADLRWKACVDTSAILERSWAALAGLGWIGKNTLLIHPKLGSYLFLGEVLINRPTGQRARPMPDLCGHCERCLKSCPTAAFPRARTLDSRRCISYWTLEKRGEILLAEEEKNKFGTWLAGCDLCQEVCPFNVKSARLPDDTKDAAFPASASDLSDWMRLLEETPEEYRARTRGSALNRVKPEQFSRNLAIALRNAAKSAEPRERIAAEVRRRADAETDPVARDEWQRTLSVFPGIGIG